MILVTRLNGPVFALNPDLVERADCTPDTVVTLVDGTKYVIAESVPEFIRLVRSHRASVIAAARRIDPATLGRRPPRSEERPGISNDQPTQDDDEAWPSRDRRWETADGTAKVVPLHRRER